MERSWVRPFAGLGVSLVAVLGIQPVTQAALVHVNTLPAGVSAGFSKAASPFAYLEGETAAQSTANADTFAAAGDAATSFFRTASTPTDSWSSAAGYDGARYAARGADSGNFSNISLYWENLTTGLPGGAYDVFVRALPGASGAETFSLYAGVDTAAVNAAAASGTVTTTSPGVAAWYKLATIDLAAGTDTFRLGVSTTASAVRVDTLFFAAVPEPSLMATIVGVSGLMLRRRRA